MDRDGSNAHPVTASFDRSVESPRWAADGKSVYVLYVDHGVSKVARVSLDGQLQDLAAGMSGAELDRPYTGGEYSVAANGVVAFTQGSPTEPGDVAVVKGGTVRRLTHLNDDLFMGKTLGQVTALKVSSSFDGKPIDAWMITPPDFDPAKKYPLILEIHGGPFAAYGPVFASELQLYCGGGLCGGLRQPAGIDLVRLRFRRPDQLQLSQPRLRRPDERRRCGHRQGLRRSEQPVRHRRIGRRPADGLDRRQHRPLQGGGGAEAGDQLDQRGAHHRLLMSARPRTGSARSPGKTRRTTGAARRCRWSAM